eukprot:m.38942 g.38942  ORF g.38942 m.38942 type:complete len:879 (-) comp11223_c0_seq1:121-2757(-)
MASAGQPIILEAGLAVSAKYRGAWCEGSVKSVDRAIRVKVQFGGSKPASLWVDAKDVKGKLDTNSSVEALHPDLKVTKKGTVQAVKDNSIYTVRFYDGDVRTVRRGQVRIMGRAHFESGQTLQDFPLTDPDSFGSPVDPLTPAESRAGRKRRRVSEGSPASPPPEAGRRRGDRSPINIVPEASEPTGRTHQVVLVDPCDAKARFWFPALVVPEPEVSRSMTSGETFFPEKHMVVRFFQDRRYAIVERRLLRLLARGTNPFVSFLRIPAFQSHTAVQHALRFIDTGELPSRFKWSTFDSSIDESDHEEDEWIPDKDAEARFHKDYAAYCTAKGVKHRRTPSLFCRDLDLFRLYTIVRQAGGSPQVTENGLWPDMFKRLGYQQTAGVPKLVSAFETHLAGYEKHCEDTMVATSNDGKGNTSEDDSNSQVKYAFKVGDSVKAASHGQRYNAKIEQRKPPLSKANGGLPRYKVHYNGWAKRYDEWLREDQLTLSDEGDAADVTGDEDDVTSKDTDSKQSKAAASKRGARRGGGTSATRKATSRGATAATAAATRRAPRSKRSLHSPEGDDDRSTGSKRARSSGAEQEDEASMDTGGEEAVVQMVEEPLTPRRETRKSWNESLAVSGDQASPVSLQPRAKVSKSKRSKKQRTKASSRSTSPKPTRSRSPKPMGTAAVTDPVAVSAEDTIEADTNAIGQEPIVKAEVSEDVTNDRVNVGANDTTASQAKTTDTPVQSSGAKRSGAKRVAAAEDPAVGNENKADNTNTVQPVADLSPDTKGLAMTQLVAPSVVPSKPERLQRSCYSPMCGRDVDSGCYSSSCIRARARLARKQQRKQQRLREIAVPLPNAPGWEDLDLQQKMRAVRQLYRIHGKALRKKKKEGHA